jgi:membrane protease YdiL (CAAX protease family)
MPWGSFAGAILPLGYLLAALLGAALISYPLHQLLQGAVSLRALLSRGALALILLSLPWLVRALCLGRRELGLPQQWRQGLAGLAVGLLAGVAVMSVLVLLEAGLGLRIGVWPPGQFAARLLQASAKPLLVGLAVGCVEELLFRGVLLGALLKYRGPLYAIAVSAFYYAALHFYHSGLKVPAEEVQWGSAFLIAADGFQHMFQWKNLDSFAALYCAGLLLGCVRCLAGSAGLALCIGVHAGWVYTLRAALALTDLNAASPWRFAVGEYDHVIGWLAAAWLALLVLPLLWAIPCNWPSCRRRCGR